MSLRNHSLCGVAVLVSTVIMTACVPYPHKETIVPEIKLSLIKNGLPVTGVDVYLSDGDVQFPAHICRAPLLVGSTTENGWVLIKPRQQWSFFYDFLNDFSRFGKYKTKSMDLCFEVDGRYVYGDAISSRLDIIGSISESCKLDDYPNVIFGSKDKLYESNASNLRICRSK